MSVVKNLQNIISNMKADYECIGDHAQWDGDGNWLNLLEVDNGAKTEAEKGRFLQIQARTPRTSPVQVGSIFTLPVMVRPMSKIEQVLCNYTGNVIYVQGLAGSEYTSNGGIVDMNNPLEAARNPLRAVSRIPGVFRMYAQNLYEYLHS